MTCECRGEEAAGAALAVQREPAGAGDQVSKSAFSSTLDRAVFNIDWTLNKHFLGPSQIHLLTFFRQCGLNGQLLWASQL